MEELVRPLVENKEDVVRLQMVKVEAVVGLLVENMEDLVKLFINNMRNVISLLVARVLLPMVFLSLI
jgi:hypothetical protein